MLTLVIPEETTFNEATNEFLTQGEVVLRLEHSLLSLSKWEAKYEKAFLGAGARTTEEVQAYFEAMIVDEEFPPGVSARLSREHIAQINAYLELKQTATFINTRPGKPSREVVTSELLYYWLFANRVDISCAAWPLNRLITLLQVFGVKNSGDKKMSQSEHRDAGRERHNLNEERLAKYGTTG